MIGVREQQLREMRERQAGKAKVRAPKVKRVSSFVSVKAKTPKRKAER